MDKKVIFLDIDGTLVDFHGKIPDSAKQALALAKKAGHHLVVCTGRSRYQISREILSLPFDGIVGGAGAFVICGGKELFHHYIQPKQRKKLISYLEENNFFYSVQTDVGTLLNRRCAVLLDDVYKTMRLTEKQRKDLEGELMIHEDLENYEHSEKVIYHMAPFGVAQVQRDLSPDFTVTAMSYQNMKGSSGEIGISGLDKSTGMQAYLDCVGSKRADAVAFGDGANDIEMLAFAGTGVAMGNAIESLKEYADFVTKPVDEDGIFFGFQKLHLI